MDAVMIISYSTEYTHFHWWLSNIVPVLISKHMVSVLNGRTDTLEMRNSEKV